MGLVLKAQCSQCDYQPDAVTICDGYHMLARCVSCRSIVNPRRDGFRFDLPPCPNCGTQLSRKELVNTPFTRRSHEQNNAEDCTCPRCNIGAIKFKQSMHFSVEIADQHPAVGEIIHGRFRGSELYVPGLWLANGNTTVQNMPDNHVATPMEFRVIEVMGAPQVTEIKLKFTQYVNTEMQHLHPIATPNG